ncbi:uncharacterized protein V6R79_008987 [Siganus canaliculatus]
MAAVLLLGSTSSTASNSPDSSSPSTDLLSADLNIHSASDPGHLLPGLHRGDTQRQTD